MPYAHSDKTMPMMTQRAPQQRPKLEGGKRFVMNTTFDPAGDQPTAIKELSEGVLEGERNQVLLGATGTGKTFTMAKVIEETQRPAIILAPNKTLAAQLYGEFKGFFPDNSVEYFVSYLRLLPARGLCAALRHLYREGIPDQRADRPDAPLGHPGAAGTRRRDHRRVCLLHLRHRLGRNLRRHDPGPESGRDVRPAQDHGRSGGPAVPRNDQAFQRGSFRVRGDTLEIFPAHLEDRAWKFSFFGEELESITEFDPLTGEKTGTFDQIRIYANSHYVTPSRP